ncbi:MAG: hypothetical protein OHK0053_28420 [Microscillaceae bacterium]
MNHQEARLEQIDSLISQYQQLLFIEEQKLLNADSDKVRGKLEKQIQYFQEKIRGYLLQRQALENPILPSSGTALLPPGFMLKWVDEFENNQHSWWMGQNQEESVFIQGEVYRMQSFVSSKACFYTLPLEVDFNQDFGLETRLSTYN